MLISVCAFWEKQIPGRKERNASRYAERLVKVRILKHVNAAAHCLGDLPEILHDDPEFFGKQGL